MLAILKKIKEILRIPDVSQLTLVFRGWNDEQKCDAANGGNVDFLDQEIRAGRRGPAHPAGIWAIDTNAEDKAIPGKTAIYVSRERDVLTDADIVSYLAELGIIATKE